MQSIDILYRNNTWKKYLSKERWIRDYWNVSRIQKSREKKIFFQTLAKINQVWSSTNKSHIYRTCQKNMYPLNLYNVNEISIFCGLSRPKTLPSLFSHIFWWNHSSQTEQHVINKPLSLSGSLSSKLERYMQNTSIFAMYDLNHFERFLIFGNGSDLFCVKHSFSLHQIRFASCSFWFFIKNAMCYECHWKYSTINADGLMLYSHIYYSKSDRKTLRFLTYGFTCFSWVSLSITS